MLFFVVCLVAPAAIALESKLNPISRVSVGFGNGSEPIDVGTMRSSYPIKGVYVDSEIGKGEMLYTADAGIIITRLKMDTSK
jgi:hypothetical protein